jgi:hypothetical protein
MQSSGAPQTLRDVGVRVTSFGADYTATLGRFIDVLIADLEAKDATLPCATLPISADFFKDKLPPMDNELHRVHLAGMAEHLAHLSGQRPPPWCETETYFLGQPLFLGAREAWGQLKKTTPSAFRRRMLFCGETLTKVTERLQAS